VAPSFNCSVQTNLEYRLSREPEEALANMAPYKIAGIARHRVLIKDRVTLRGSFSCPKRRRTDQRTGTEGRGWREGPDGIDLHGDSLDDPRVRNP
jgi:hypothetical protein